MSEKGSIQRNDVKRKDWKKHFSVLWYIYLCVLFIYQEAIFVEEKQWYYLTQDKKFHTFPQGIGPKMNVITRLVLELVNYNVVVQPRGQVDFFQKKM